MKNTIKTCHKDVKINFNKYKAMIIKNNYKHYFTNEEKFIIHYKKLIINFKYYQ